MNCNPNNHQHQKEEPMVYHAKASQETKIRLNSTLQNLAEEAIQIADNARRKAVHEFYKLFPEYIIPYFPFGNCAA